MIWPILVVFVLLIVVVVEINQWAHDIGIPKQYDPQVWAKTIGFILGLLCGVLATVMLMGVRL